MHETSLIDYALNAVETKATQMGIREVREVGLVIGKAKAVPLLMEKAFQIIRMKHPMCRGASLHLGVGEIRRQCAAPPLTLIEQVFPEAGRLAADLLAELIENPKLPPKHLKFGPVRLVRRQSTRSFKFYDPRITKAVERIRRDAATGLTAADVLAEFPYSRRITEKRFRAATGKTILEEIQDVRFEKICELLMTDIPIGHIAGRCGMQSDSFLKRFFKARTGLTLREWRNRQMQPALHRKA